MNLIIGVCSHSKIRATAYEQDFSDSDRRIWLARGWRIETHHRPLTPDSPCLDCMKHEEPTIKMYHWTDAPAWIKMLPGVKGKWFIMSQQRELVVAIAERLTGTDSAATLAYSMHEVLDNATRHWVAVTT